MTSVWVWIQPCLHLKTSEWKQAAEAVYISWHFQLLPAYYSSSQCGYQNSEEPVAPWAPHHTDSLCETIGRWSYLVCIFFSQAEAIHADGSVRLILGQRKTAGLSKRPQVQTKERNLWENRMINHCWPWVEWAVYKRTRVYENIQMVSVVCAFPSYAFPTCGDMGFHPGGHKHPWNDELKFQEIILSVGWQTKSCID